MLVLSRKLNEKIVIDGGIEITVVKIDRNSVRIGIQAPPDVKVFRQEIIESGLRAAANQASVDIHAFDHPMVADATVVGAV